MNSLMMIRGGAVQTLIFLSALALASAAQAQYGNDSKDSNSSSSTSSGQSSQKTKSTDDKSKGTDKDAEKKKMERNVKDTIKRDQSHELKPSEYDPPK